MTRRSGDQRLAVTDERRPHDARIVQLAADIDLYAGARGDRHTRQRDRALQGGGEGSAGDLAFSGFGYEHLLVRAQNAAPLEQQTHQLALRAPRAHGLECLTADEGPLARLERHGPAETGLEGVGVLVHVTAVEVHARLQTQCVTGTETAGGDTGGIQRLPHSLCLSAGQHHLEAVFARVAGARDEPAVDFAPEEWLEPECGRRARR